MTTNNPTQPTSIKILGGFGIVIAVMFFLVGGVNSVLSILDRTYSNFMENILIGLMGVPMLAVSLGLKNLQRWGWYGYTALAVLWVIWTLFHYQDINGIIVGIFFAAALIWSLTPEVRKHFFPV
ncbi:MAG: hypothetical protein JW763_10945 [candidate division Zixibacteria bacterium]|nr:hypothetical protein [candidate division Zixibacteria bacterium]